MKKLLFIHLLFFLFVSVYEYNNFDNNPKDLSEQSDVIWIDQNSGGNVVMNLKRFKTLELSDGHFILLKGFPSSIEPPDG